LKSREEVCKLVDSSYVVRQVVHQTERLQWTTTTERRCHSISSAGLGTSRQTFPSLSHSASNARTSAPTSPPRPSSPVVPSSSTSPVDLVDPVSANRFPNNSATSLLTVPYSKEALEEPREVMEGREVAVMPSSPQAVTRSNQRRGVLEKLSEKPCEVRRRRI
jgi:hypothetical protein